MRQNHIFIYSADNVSKANVPFFRYKLCLWAGIPIRYRYIDFFQPPANLGQCCVLCVLLQEYFCKHNRSSIVCGGHACQSTMQSNTIHAVEMTLKNNHSTN